MIISLHKNARTLQESHQACPIRITRILTGNGRIADVLRTHHFNNSEVLQHTLLRYVFLYNQHLPQSSLRSKTPVQTMKEWYISHPHLFHKNPDNLPGWDS